MHSNRLQLSSDKTEFLWCMTSRRANIVYPQQVRLSVLLPLSFLRRPATWVFLSSRTCRWRPTSSGLSCAASACYDNCAVSGDRYRPLFSSHCSARLLQQRAGWTTRQLDPASSVGSGSKRCSTAFRDPPLRTHYGCARQSSLAPCSRPNPLQSRRTYLPSSERQCTSTPVVLLHQRR